MTEAQSGLGRVLTRQWDNARMSWEGLDPPYATIVADPPWPYDDGATQWNREKQRTGFLPYSSMSVEQIAALPVADLAAPGAHLYLWTTNRYLRDALGIVELWGFSYSTTIVWCKEPRGKGTTGRYVITTEFIIHAQAPENRPPRAVQRAGAIIKAAREAAGLTRAEVFHRIRGGKKTGIVNNWELDICLPNEDDWRRLQDLLPTLAGVPRPEVPPPSPREPVNLARLDSTWFQWKRAAHSTKPPAALDTIEQVSPSPYVELFARQPRLGWDHWGWGYERGGAA
jgi:N6-adenosine-specific RNA methylase IME4